MVPVGVEIPRTKAGTEAREILSQEPKFTVNRGEMSSTGGGDKRVKKLAEPQRAGLVVGGGKSTSVDSEVSLLTVLGANMFGAQLSQLKEGR